MGDNEDLQKAVNAARGIKAVIQAIAPYAMEILIATAIILAIFLIVSVVVGNILGFSANAASAPSSPIVASATPPAAPTSGTADSTLSANDYGGVIVSSTNGYTFTEYYQDGGATWSGDSLSGSGSGKTVGQAGCNVTSHAIALSAVTGDTITPRDINQYDIINSSSSNLLNKPEFSQYASDVTISEYVGKPTVNSLITYMQQGKVVILKYDASVGSTKWANTTHFVVCADYKKESGVDFFYIINPNEGATMATGWYQAGHIFDAGLVNAKLVYKN